MKEKVLSEMAGKRLDQVLSSLSGISRSKIATLCATQQVLVNGRPAVKAQLLQIGDEILWDFPKKIAKSLETPAYLPIVYEDNELIVVDKPVGMVAHTAVGWEGPTVLGALLAKGHHIQTSGDPERQGIVHRLDVGTTGLMVVAKNECSYLNLKAQFANREVEKVYHTVIQGYLPHEQGSIDAPIGRHPKASFKMAVVSQGKKAITHYRLIHKLNQASLLEIRLETGRTHQIRVHMQALKHPVIGDRLYGANPKTANSLGLDRQWLHALKLGFRHPITQAQLTFESPYPKDLQDSLERLEIR